MDKLAPSGLSQTEVAEVAAKIRTQLRDRFGFQNAADIYEVVGRLGGKIVYEGSPESGSDHGSIVVRGRCDFTIYLPETTPERRNRFTIAHELGHYFLHARQGLKPGTAYRSLEYGRQEWEANWFAANLLMPSGEFKAAWDQHHDLAQVADWFGVSLAAARVRQETLGRG